MVSLGSITKTHLAHAAYRFIQLVLALAVCGLYGVDLTKARKENKYTDGKWVRSSFSPTQHPQPT